MTIKGIKNNKALVETYTKTEIDDLIANGGGVVPGGDVTGWSGYLTDYAIKYRCNFDPHLMIGEDVTDTSITEDEFYDILDATLIVARGELGMRDLFFYPVNKYASASISALNIDFEAQDGVGLKLTYGGGLHITTSGTSTITNEIQGIDIYIPTRINVGGNQLIYNEFDPAKTVNSGSSVSFEAAYDDMTKMLDRLQRATRVEIATEGYSTTIKFNGWNKFDNGSRGMKQWYMYDGTKVRTVTIKADPDASKLTISYQMKSSTSSDSESIDSITVFE